MGLLVETLSVLHPDVDRMREEPGPRSVIRRGNEMGRKVAKWLPGALIFTLQHTHSARLWEGGGNTFLLVSLLQLNSFFCIRFFDHDSSITHGCILHHIHCRVGSVTPTQASWKLNTRKYCSTCWGIFSFQITVFIKAYCKTWTKKVQVWKLNKKQVHCSDGYAV